MEIESDEGCMSPEPVAATGATAATLDDFQEISLPTTPTVVDGCNNVFEEHFKVLESLESYLETQNLAGATAEDNDESGISTSPSIHEVVVDSLELNLSCQYRLSLNLDVVLAFVE